MMHKIPKMAIKMMAENNIKNLSYGMLFGSIVYLQSKKEASKYLDAMVKTYMRDYPMAEDEAKRLCLANIKFYLGYFEQETFDSIWALFKEDKEREEDE